MLSNKQTAMICMFLSVASLVVFWRVNHSEFIIFDDPLYVTQNSHIKNGLSMDGVRWALTTGNGANWHPLTWLSLMLDAQFFGLEPRWYHITNLLFHMANTLLLFFVLYRMTKARWESAFVAALFALHPLHIESVAWVAERKDVLSAFFWIATMGAYSSYVEKPQLQRYLIIVLYFGLGLMAKPMLVTLPFVLLLLDYWPLKRFQKIQLRENITTAVHRDAHKAKPIKKKIHGAQAGVKAKIPPGPKYRSASIYSLLREKLPLFALTALSCIVTYLVQERGGAVQSWPLSVRISNAFISYITYIGQSIWPKDLAFLYPLPSSMPTWRVLGAVILVTAITITVTWNARKVPYMAVGWLWYVGTLVPVIGLVQVGFQTRADRYTYIPLTGLFILATWGISELSKNWRYRKTALFSSSIVVLVCFGIAGWRQVGYWRNTFTLFDHTLSITKDNYIVYSGRGTAYKNAGNYSEALKDFDKVIEIKPDYAEAYVHRWSIYSRLGNGTMAVENLITAARLGHKDAQDLLKKRDIGWQ